LEAVNALFRRILDEPLGGLTYGEPEALRPPAGRIPQAVGPSAEIVLLHRPGGRGGGEDADAPVSLEDALDAEAREIGARILRWTDKHGAPLEVLDRDAGSRRAA